MTRKTSDKVAFYTKRKYLSLVARRGSSTSCMRIENYATQASATMTFAPKGMRILDST